MDYLLDLLEIHRAKQTMTPNEIAALARRVGNDKEFAGKRVLIKREDGHRMRAQWRCARRVPQARPRERAFNRARTYAGIARAMAEQWS